VTEFGLDDDVARGGGADQPVVDVPIEAFHVDPVGRGGVRLRVEVDEQDLPFGRGERRREVDGGGRLSDSALLIRDCEDPARHHSSHRRTDGSLEQALPESRRREDSLPETS